MPCTEYLCAKTNKPRSFLLADSIEEKNLEIIAYFRPNLWLKKNPVGTTDVQTLHVEYTCCGDGLLPMFNLGVLEAYPLFCCTQIKKMDDIECNKRTCVNVEFGPHG